MKMRMGQHCTSESARFPGVLPRNQPTVRKASPAARSTQPTGGICCLTCLTGQPLILRTANNSKPGSRASPVRYDSTTTLFLSARC